MTIGGVPVRLHASLLLMLGVWVVWGAAQWGLAGLGTSAVWLAAFVASVLIHELGHVEVARRFGIRTHAIVLLPIGGAAQMQMRRVSPMVDAAVSVAGPLASLLLGVVLALTGWLLGIGAFLTLGAVNLLLGVFNLIPAFPMDGGRILRALLVHRVGRERGTAWALGVGAGFAVCFGAVGLAYQEVGLLLLAAFMALLQWREFQVQRLLRERPELLS